MAQFNVSGQVYTVAQNQKLYARGSDGAICITGRTDPAPRGARAEYIPNVLRDGREVLDVYLLGGVLKKKFKPTNLKIFAEVLRPPEPVAQPADPERILTERIANVIGVDVSQAPTSRTFNDTLAHYRNLNCINDSEQRFLELTLSLDPAQHPRAYTQANAIMHRAAGSYEQIRQSQLPPPVSEPNGNPAPEAQPNAEQQPYSPGNADQATPRTDGTIPPRIARPDVIPKIIITVPENSKQRQEYNLAASNTTQEVIDKSETTRTGQFEAKRTDHQYVLGKSRDGKFEARVKVAKLRAYNLAIEKAQELDTLKHGLEALEQTLVGVVKDWDQPNRDLDAICNRAEAYLRRGEPLAAPAIPETPAQTGEPAPQGAQYNPAPAAQGQNGGQQQHNPAIGTQAVNGGNKRIVKDGLNRADSKIYDSRMEELLNGRKANPALNDSSQGNPTPVAQVAHAKQDPIGTTFDSRALRSLVANARAFSESIHSAEPSSDDAEIRAFLDAQNGYLERPEGITSIPFRAEVVNELNGNANPQNKVEDPYNHLFDPFNDGDPEPDGLESTDLTPAVELKRIVNQGDEGL